MVTERASRTTPLADGELNASIRDHGGTLGDIGSRKPGLDIRLLFNLLLYRYSARCMNQVEGFVIFLLRKQT